MNLKLIFVGAIFLVPHLLPHFYENFDFSLQNKIRDVSGKAKEVAPTGKAVESIEDTEEFVINWTQNLKNFSFAVGVLLVALGIFI